jgi:hypothetical protein
VSLNDPARTTLDRYSRDGVCFPIERGGVHQGCPRRALAWLGTLGRDVAKDPVAAKATLDRYSILLW